MTSGSDARLARKWFTLGAVVGILTLGAMPVVFQAWGSRLGVLDGLVGIAVFIPMVVIQRWLALRAREETRTP
jgi:hypothetical protein